MTGSGLRIVGVHLRIEGFMAEDSVKVRIRVQGLVFKGVRGLQSSCQAEASKLDNPTDLRVWDLGFGVWGLGFGV